MRLEFPAQVIIIITQGYVNPANTMLVMDVVLIAPTITGTYALRFQNNIQCLFNRVTLKYGGGPQEDILQYGLLVRLLTETTSTGQNNNANQMAISDGIGGSSIGAVITRSGGSVSINTLAANVSNGTTLKFFAALASDFRTVFQTGDFATVGAFNLNGVNIEGKTFKVFSVAETEIQLEAYLPAGDLVAYDISLAPLRKAGHAFGLLNTRQAYIQGLAGGYGGNADLNAEDDLFSGNQGNGTGAVPNLSVGLPSGVNTPTTPYSVRRYMVNFALGMFTQDKVSFYSNCS